MQFLNQVILATRGFGQNQQHSVTELCLELSYHLLFFPSEISPRRMEGSTHAGITTFKETTFQIEQKELPITSYDNYS